jgi:hypothetical protein
MVRAAGFEPASVEVSPLLIVAFLCQRLHLPIRILISNSKAFVAALRNFEQEIRCQSVSAEPPCVGAVSGTKSAEAVSEVCQRRDTRQPFPALSLPAGAFLARSTPPRAQFGAEQEPLLRPTLRLPQAKRSVVKHRACHSHRGKQGFSLVGAADRPGRQPLSRARQPTSGPPRERFVASPREKRAPEAAVSSCPTRPDLSCQCP